MRIISKYSDYYDSVMKHGVDMSKVFLRETKELDPFILPSDWKKARVNIWGNPTFNEFPELSVGYHRHPLKAYITSIYVLFAGKMYGGFVLHSLKTPYGQPDPCIWTVDALDKANEEYELNLHEKKRFYAKETDHAIACKVLAIKGSDLLLPWATANSLSIVSIVYDERNNKNNRLLIENPCLKDIDFQKVIDPFTAYQELEMYIGGVIGQNPQPADVSDSVKIQQHGFDPLWSFRKHKLDNTKERKK